MSVALVFLLQPAAARAGEGRDGKDFEVFIQKQIYPVRKADPEKAVQLYDQFLQQHPALHPNVAVLVQFYKANVLYLDIKDPAAALALYDQTLAAYGPAAPPAQRAAPATMLRLMSGKAFLLASEKRFAEAGALWQANTEAIFAAGLENRPTAARDTARLLHPYVGVLEQENKKAEAVALIQRALGQVPGLMSGEVQEPAGSLYDKLVSLLIEAGHPEDALRWAKQQYRLCDFDKGALDRATKLLARVWASQETFPAITAFAKAQQDAAAPNPLAAVPAPTWDPAPVRELLKRTDRGPGERVILLLALGEAREAMLAARRLIMDNPTGEQGVREAARVFKATDLNVVRANQFVTFYQAGQGENPMTKFLQDTANAAATAPAAPGSVPTP